MKIYRVRTAAEQSRFATSEDGLRFFGVSGELFENDLEATDELLNVQSILTPVVPPTIYCVGLNYRKHAEETGAKIPEHPVIFLKSPTALQDPGQPIMLPRHLRSDQVDFEGELAIVIGRTGKNISESEALDCVAGYTIANDVSARDWQKTWGGSQWSRGKTFDTFCPVGPALVTRDEIPNPDDLGLTTRVNGEIMQESRTSDMIFSVRKIIAFLSGSTTLEAGTLILTGTPEGVGMGRKPPVYLKPGDMVEIRIEGLGQLRNPVIDEIAP
jgi:2-keto-4-pentenoate hydratase/2-oxohepta-3-ene-1,7-dioic acid hydratase in catechol pathway